MTVVVIYYLITAHLYTNSYELKGRKLTKNVMFLYAFKKAFEKIIQFDFQTGKEAP